MTNIAVIPARGGSKRIPRKNIRMFAGQPMIAYSIQVALESGLFERVIVSTDDEEIADVARQFGADAPFLRPQVLSDDHVGLADVMVHAVDWASGFDHNISAVCCVLATAPFIQLEDLKKGIDLLEEGSWQYVFSATHFGFPIFRSFTQTEHQGLNMFFPEHLKTRSQDLPEAMHDAGQFYWGRPQAWLDGLSVLDQWSTVVNLPSWRVQDIDTIDDWQRAEIIYSMMKSNHHLSLR